jgi:hypothetical protein
MSGFKTVPASDRRHFGTTFSVLWNPGARMRLIPNARSAASLTVALIFPLLAFAQGTNSAVIEKQISSAFAKKDYRHIVELMSERRELGGHIPAALYYIEANAEYQLGDKSAALSVLNDYFAAANQNQYPYNEAVALAARIRDEQYSTNERETKIIWEKPQDANALFRRGRIDIKGQTARLVAVTLECTFAGRSRHPRTITGMPPNWDYYVKLYEDEPDRDDHAPPSDFPGDVPVSEIIDRQTLTVTLHLLTGESAQHFPGNVRPPWDGWYDEWTKTWAAFAERGANGVVLWDRRRGSYPFTRPNAYDSSEILSATYWQRGHWNRVYELSYVDSYRISFPSLQVTQSVDLAEKLSDKGPNDPDFCQLFSSGCHELRSMVLQRFKQLAPTECSPVPYVEPENFAEAVTKAQ